MSYQQCSDRGYRFIKEPPDEEVLRYGRQTYDKIQTDPGVCGTDLKTEYTKAVKEMGCSIGDVENMILYAVDGIFLPPPIKAALRSSIMAEIKAINAKI